MKNLNLLSIGFIIINMFFIVTTACVSYGSYLEDGKEQEKKGNFIEAINIYDEGIRDITDNGQTVISERNGLYYHLSKFLEAKSKAEEKERQRRIIEENANLKKQPVLITLKELNDNYTQKAYGNFIVKVEVDNDNVFIQDQERFSIFDLLFENKKIQGDYNLKKPNTIYELTLILKGVDNYGIYLSDIKGDLYSIEEKKIIEEKIAVEKVMAEKAEAERRETERIAEIERLETARIAEAERAEAARIAELEKWKNFILRPGNFNPAEYKKVDLFEAVSAVDKMVRGSGSFGDLLFGELFTSDEKLGFLSNIQYFVSELVFVSQNGTNIRFKTYDNAISQDMKINARSGLTEGQKANIYYRVSKNPQTEWQVYAIEKL